MSLLEDEGVEPLNCNDGKDVKVEVVNAHVEKDENMHFLEVSCQPSFSKNSENFFNFDTLNNNERSLVDLQKRTAKTSNLNESGDSEKLTDNSDCQEQLMIVPTLSAGKNVASLGNKSEKAFQFKTSSIVKEKQNVAKKNSVHLVFDQSSKDDISTCINFNLTKSHVKINPSSKTQKSVHLRYLGLL